LWPESDPEVPRMSVQAISPPSLGRRFLPNLWDCVALDLLIYGGEQINVPLSALDSPPVSLDPANLPEYALRTTLRMLAAIVCSLVFTFVYATLAAKSRRAEIVLIPLLDILQSVPILGFLTFTVVFFMNLFPGRVLGAELACVFAIFTSQAWNMTFSMYQSMRNVPKDLEEASQSFHLTG
jgi:NitT/TauT family transport system permease protein